MKICDDLRASVLQAAIQGKLTKQLPEDGDARDLLTQITETRTKLNSKLDKGIEPIDEGETPFDIPNSWKWSYIGEVFSHTAGKALNSKNTIGEKHKYLTTSNVYWDHFELDKLKEMYYTDEEVDKYSVKKGDLLVLEGGDVGRAAIWDREESYCIQNHLHRLRPYLAICVKYFYYCMMYFKRAGMVNGKGIAIQGLSSGALHSIIVPFPPLAEQHRIVARVEDFMTKIDELEVIETELEALKKAFPEDMKAALLQAAMQGKLTEQLTEDGDANDLFSEIEHIRKDLQNRKLIKKHNDVEEITSDVIPFDIPNNWRWTRFVDIVDYRMGKTPPRKEYEWWGNDVPWASIADMPENGIIEKTSEFISTRGFEEKFGGRISPKGTMLMSFKLTVGRVSILGIDALHNEAIISVFPLVEKDNIMRDYLFKVLPMMSNYGDTKNAIKGKTLNDTSIANLLIPLPPLAEQKRIVEKLDKLLPLCDGLPEEKLMRAV